ncbi:MAG: hypothetical protein R2698_15400, partial [Microthrixaceae bacterium]
FVTVALLVGVAAYVVVKQARNDYPLNFDWPEHFDRANVPTLLMWLLLGVEAAVEAARAGWRRNAGFDPRA